MEDLGSALVWFRNDLRQHDNPALCEAIRHVNVARGGRSPRARLYALIVLAPYEMRELHHWGLAKADYYLRSAKALERGLAQQGIPLIVQHEEGPTFARPSEYYERLGETMVELCRKRGVEAVYMNAEYDGVALDRDAAISAKLDAAGILHHTSHDQCVVMPGAIATKSGTPFKVFTQFKNSWAAWIGQHDVQVVQPATLELSGETGEALQLDRFDIPPGFAEDGKGPDLDLEHVRQAFPAGEQAAMAKLEAFLKQSISSYHEDRNHFASAGASRMSAPLAIGAISLKQCLIAARKTNGGSLLAGSPGVVQWISELCWRDFYRHVLVNFPYIARGHAFRPEYEELPWRGWPVREDGTSPDAAAEEDLQRWVEGRTGVPIVDAAMRQLRREGWLSNRLRMVVAMYLTKDLLIHWRRGERHFQEHLTDYDYASNNGGWQWSASTGTDAQPYFRIFNPLLQSEKFDPPGDYIRKYVAELANVKAPAIHEPAKRMSKEAFSKLNYPKPIIDHAEAKARALDMFKAMGQSTKRPYDEG